VGDLDPAQPLTDAEFGVTSQNGEDGVLQEILDRIGTRSRHFVEFGANTGKQANCVLLADLFDWTGIFLESGREAYELLEAKYADNARVTTVEAAVTVENFESLLGDAGCPSSFDVLSIDIDGNDFWVWQTLERFVPRVVVIEYNGELELDARLVMPRDDEHEWDGTDYFGASLGAYLELGAEKGYRLVHTERTGTNAFFVREEEAAGFPALDDVPRHRSNYWAAGIRHKRDPKGRPFQSLGTNELVDAERW
jgi:hypothetical protein